MKLGIKDERVLRAFAEHRSLEGHKLSTDGKSLDGHWMGGRGLAEWRRGKRGMQIHLPDTGGRIGQSIQRALKRHAAPVDFEGYKTFAERASRDPRRDPRKPKGEWALVRSRGMDDDVLSVHKTETDAEKAMRKRGGEPRSLFTGGMHIENVGPQGRAELIHVFGKWTVRPVMRRDVMRRR